MTVDATAAGHDLSKVGVALSGAAAILPLPDASFTAPASTVFGADEFTIPSGFVGLGLRTADGAPEWADEQDGDAIEFFEDGYSIPSGMVNSTCKMILAQTEPMVVELKAGTALDANGVADVDLGGNAKRYVLYTEEVYKTADPGVMLYERRMAEVSVQSVVAAKPERGSVRGWTVTLKNHRSSLFGSKHYRYAQKFVDATPTP